MSEQDRQHHRIQLRRVVPGQQEEQMRTHVNVHRRVRRTDELGDFVQYRFVGHKLADAEYGQQNVERLQELGHESQQRTLHVPHEGNRGEGIHLDDLIVVFWPGGSHHEESGRALGVAHVLQSSVSRLLQYVVDRGRNVVASDFVPGKLPERIVVVRVDRGVIARVPIAARISQPHIVALVREQVGQCIARANHQPVGRAAQQTVHQQHDRSVRVACRLHTLIRIELKCLNAYIATSEAHAKSGSRRVSTTAELSLSIALLLLLDRLLSEYPTGLLLLQQQQALPPIREQR
uniref:Uncharacterized protein n=1 Tax=Anopheles coluzzii TaxID=1518534 RepID=A0A8W7PSX4_ANOCL